MNTVETSHPERPRGFPTVWAERELIANFCQEFGPQVIEHAKKRLPDYPLTENQLFFLTMFYYGVYFYDHICGGHLLSGRTTDNEQSHKYRRKYRLPPLTDTPDNIRKNIPNWPVNLVDENRNNRPCATNFGFIEIPARSLSNVEYDTAARYRYRYSSHNPVLDFVFQLFAAINQEESTYLTMEALNRGILPGIEEAQHTHFWYLERKHYGNDLQNTNLVDGPLKSYLLISDAKSGLAHDSSLKYHAGVGAEFAAHIVTSTYVRKYHPLLWAEGGQEKYHEAIMDHRRRLAATKATIIRPK